MHRLSEEMPARNGGRLQHFIVAQEGLEVAFSPWEIGCCFASKTYMGCGAVISYCVCLFCLSAFNEGVKPMSRFLIASDAFKGTLTSLEAGRVMSDAIKATLPDARTRCIALSDGGDGTMEAMLAHSSGEVVHARVSGPVSMTVDAPYAILPDGTAVIEMSAACGIKLIQEGVSTGRTTTHGVGELLLDAASRGCSKVILGLGSSTTTDGGVGAAYACGVKFFDRYVEPFEPVGATLDAVQTVDVSDLDPRVKALDIQVLCAVENPLCGTMGTSATYAPNKGALPTVVQALDRNLAHLADVVKSCVGVDMLDVPCGGAGGGMGAGMAAFFGAQPCLAIDAVLDIVDFDSRLAGVDYVVTGEGCFDTQSLHGKVVSGVARRCKAAGVPLIAVVGSMDPALAEVGKSMGVTTFAVLNPNNRPLSQLTQHPRSRLSRAMTRVAELIAQGADLPGVIEPAREDS